MGAVLEPPPPPGRPDLLSTYRHVRVALAVLLAFLLVGVLAQAARDGCFAGSISAYYFTPARAIFVGSLCALGACLIAYRGQLPGEDLALNVSGFLAFIVAFVPARVPKDPAAECNATNLPTTGQIADGVTSDMTALFATTTATVLLVWLLAGRPRPTGRGSVVPSLAAFYVLLLAGWVYFENARGHFLRYAHYEAAGALFVGMIAVVGINARAARRRDPGGARDPLRIRWYGRIFVLMVVSAAGIGGAMAAFALLGGSLPYGLLVLEFALLLEFGGYWFVQTRSLWSDAPA